MIEMSKAMRKLVFQIFTLTFKSRFSNLYDFTF